MSVLAAAVIGGALVYVFMNGANDSANLLGPVVSTRAIDPHRAVFVAAAAELAGALLMGSAVAATIGTKFVDLGAFPDRERVLVVVACAIGTALGWAFLTFLAAVTTSATHALLGAWIGAFCAFGGLDAVAWGKIVPVFGAILAAPLLGLALAGLGFRFWNRAAVGLHRSVLPWMQKLEIALMAGLAMAHGANDSQKGMAVAATALWMLQPAGAEFGVPLWLRGACAVAIALGVLVGAGRTIRTIGYSLYRLQPLHSFNAQGVAATTIAAATFFGVPLSSSHVIGSSVLGAGAADRTRAVNWTVAGSLATNWGLTFPSTAAAAYILVKLVLLAGDATALF